jgi:MvaI/BcnI restriction endonuclease family
MFDSIQKLALAMGGRGTLRLYAKMLAPNDNSKNQIYLGGGFGALNIIPHGAIETDSSENAGSVRDRAKASVEFSWITTEGSVVAPNTQLILYPKYPEVRMSGFLKGCNSGPSEVLRSRATGRVLFIGVLPNRKCFGFAVFADHPLAVELGKIQNRETAGVFFDLSNYKTGLIDTKATLLQTLCAISNKGWLESKKMGSDGIALPYAARNGGGYTLEAELGIAPNSYSEPDYLGWEVKQYGVADFIKLKAKSPVTLMTPEPTGGEYRDLGVTEFMKRYGYADKGGIADRVNFGGIYVNGAAQHADTKLALKLEGYDARTNKIEDLSGGLILVSDAGDIAAQWHFSHMIEHWNRKHAKAVYVPSETGDNPIRYRFSSSVNICEGTDFLLFIKAVSDGAVYLDPAIKMENASSQKPMIKRRNQFRIRQDAISQLYSKSLQIDACLP